ncbi:MAG: hydrogenase maturation nickel metallochaperone HypA [Candidatus Omnitrophica bacterium]|nr:hydrogenase maturation nickel metallochaperone HypA [Candidatus Omnitrophota bacterium]
MHECHQVQKVVTEAQAMLKEKGIQDPKKANLVVGELLGFDEGCIRLYWEEMTQSTPLSKTALSIQFVPAMLECAACKIKFAKKGSNLLCPQCNKIGTLPPSGSSGKEFFINKIE